MSYQTGGWSSSPSTIGMLSYSVRPRCKSWLRNRPWPSGYPQQRGKNLAGGMSHLAWSAWDTKIFSLPECFRSQGPRDIQVVRRDQMAGLVRALQWYAEWSGASPSLLCSVVQGLQCFEPLIKRDDLLDVSMLEVVREALWLPQPLWRRLWYWERMQSTRRGGQWPCISLTNWRMLLSLIMPLGQRWW